MVTVNNVLYKSKNIAIIFERLAKDNVNVDMISQTSPFKGHVNVSFTTSKEDIYTIDEIAKEIKGSNRSIEVSKE